MLNMFLAAAMTAAAPGPLDQDVPQTAPDAPAAQDDGPIVVEGQVLARNKRVCKRSVSTGSIMARVICKTAGEWEIERDRQIAQAERNRMTGLMSNEGRRINSEERTSAPK